MKSITDGAFTASISLKLINKTVCLASILKSILSNGPMKFLFTARIAGK